MAGVRRLLPPSARETTAQAPHSIFKQEDFYVRTHISLRACSKCAHLEIECAFLSAYTYISVHT